jgi:hypothetical protein
MSPESACNVACVAGDALGFPLDLRDVAWYKLPVSTSTDRPGLANGHIFCARIPADLPPRFIQ